MKQSSRLALLGLCFLFVIAGPLMAKGADEESVPDAAGPSVVDVNTMITIPKAATYVLPRPIVYFTLVEEFGEEYDFSAGVDLNTDWNYESYIKLALNLGARSADGMAFYAGDEMGDFRKNADTIEKMMSVLGIDEDVREPIEALKAALIDRDDGAVKSLSDDVYTSVEKVLLDQDKMQLAQFISLGSWIEGAYIVSTALVENYDEEVSKVVALHSVVRTYQSVLENQKEFVNYEPILQEIQAALDSIYPLIVVEKNAPVPLENIEEIQLVLSDLKKAIEAN